MALQLLCLHSPTALLSTRTTEAPSLPRGLPGTTNDRPDNPRTPHGTTIVSPAISTTEVFGLPFRAFL